MDVVLLGEGFNEGLLEHAQVGGAELEDLRRPGARHEKRRLWVLVLERLALVHCPLCAGIFGFASRFVSRPCFTNRSLGSYSHLSQHVGVVCERGANPKSWRAGNFFRASASAAVGSEPVDATRKRWRGSEHVTPT